MQGVKHLETTAPINGITPQKKEPTLEALLAATLTSALRQHSSKQAAVLNELKTTQTNIKSLHSLQEIVKLRKGNDKDLLITDEMRPLIEKARSFGVHIPVDANGRITSEQRTELHDSIRVTLEDLNLEHNMNFKKASHISETLIQFYSMARKIENTLDSTKKNIIRGIAGR